ncbi:hypothetical protein F5Y15DRAFT_420819 [Xylariaceae sp. FL0016]|nr:hypothetical protein F5Y15DRAFT_420819 [Xylariaceae sp. FL0016]
MLLTLSLIVAALTWVISVQAGDTQSLYGQCGGKTWSGPSACPTDATCYNDGNPWYSQCVAVGDAGEPLPPPPIPTIVTVTVTLSPDDPWTEPARRPWLPQQTDAPPFGGEASVTPRQASGPGTTLQSGWYWIRAVASPNYHKYLQTKPANQPGTAILDSSKSAGQYTIRDGQLIANTGTGNPPLYLNVEKPPDPASPPRTLATRFNTTENTFGSFIFSGDAVTWSAPDVKRQNLAAWLVCKDQALFINTGAYAYQTPSGCADRTIHYYNDAHTND